MPDMGFRRLLLGVRRVEYRASSSAYGGGGAGVVAGSGSGSTPTVLTQG